MAAENEEFICRCNPCQCDEPPTLASDEIKEEACKCAEEPCDCDTQKNEVEKTSSSEQFIPKSYKLNEFVRAKQLLKQMSTKTGISLYDHLSEVIVKALDFYAPSRALNFVEEISLNMKRYRFQETKDNLNESYYMSKCLVNDASLMVENWQQNVEWSISQQELPEQEQKLMVAFPSFQRFMCCLEQANVTLQREEAFRLSLAIRQFHMTRPFIDRVRFFGKIFGSQKHYYILEVETKNGQAVAEDTWEPKASTTTRYFKKIKKMAEASSVVEVAEDDVTDNLPGAGDTFERAGKAVTDPDILLAYQTTSGLPADARNTPAITTFTTSCLNKKTEETGTNEDSKQVTGIVASAMDALNFTFDDLDALAEQGKWEGYQADLMSDFPVATTEEESEIPPELEGNGINRRYFYVCNNIGDKWILLPPVTPQQINHSRTNRWYLTGNLNARVKTYPKFPGREGHYLRALVARITAGAQVSPKGYFQMSNSVRRDSSENDDDYDEELGEDDEELREEGDDTVYPAMKFEPPNINSLLDPSLELWCHHTGYILPQGRFVWWNPVQPQAKKKLLREDEDDDSDYDDDEDEGEDAGSERETGPTLFQSLVEDQANVAKLAWTPRASLTIFKDFQVAGIQSNIWPGATAICTARGKSENVYIGDGLKLLGRCFAPIVSPPGQTEYVSDGPELKEIEDPTVEQEQNWLSRLQLLEIADIEDEFVDNERTGKLKHFDFDDDE